VRGAMLIGPAWKRNKRLAAAPMPVANRTRCGSEARELTPTERA
jgi:hypothetical protein